MANHQSPLTFNHDQSLWQKVQINSAMPNSGERFRVVELASKPGGSFCSHISAHNFPQRQQKIYHSCHHIVKQLERIISPYSTRAFLYISSPFAPRRSWSAGQREAQASNLWLVQFSQSAHWARHKCPAKSSVLVAGTSHSIYDWNVKKLFPAKFLDETPGWHRMKQDETSGCGCAVQQHQLHKATDSACEPKPIASKLQGEASRTLVVVVLGFQDIGA